MLLTLAKPTRNERMKRVLDRLLNHNVPAVLGITLVLKNQKMIMWGSIWELKSKNDYNRRCRGVAGKDSPTGNYDQAL